MKTDYQVAIIGTGFGGLGIAIQLKKAGIHSFIILEKNDSVGGTWHDNTYPGATCDVPSHLYSFSFEPKYDWSRKFATQPEILDYLKHSTEKYHLGSHIKFQTEVTECVFNEHTGLWHITTTTGSYTARSIISACGQLNRPSYPKIPGLDTFAGKQFHSARWDHSYDLHNKKVAVIGTGASAIQFVPEVAKVAEHVTLYQRSAPWILPKGDYAYFDFQKWLFRRLPFWQKIYRAYIYWSNEFRFLALTKDSLINHIIKRWGLRHIKKYISDAELITKVTPDYPVGCSRILISNNYYKTLTQKNVEVVTDPITNVDASSITTAKGVRTDVDVIIFGTGFQASKFLAPMKFIGRHGIDLGSLWKDGAESYKGINIPGFPNLFLLYGPNTNLAHNSIIYMLEAQFTYIVQCIQLMNERQLKYIDVKQERSDQYNSEIQEALQGSIWTGDCNSWYKTTAGKNTNNWPSYSFAYKNLVSAINTNDYDLIK